MRLLILSALFLSGFLSAQTPDSLKSKKWAIGLSYSPDLCFRTKYTSKMSNYYGEKEKPKAGMTAGLNFLYKLMDRVGIEVGILYSTKGEKMYSPSITWVTPGFEYNTPSGTSGSYTAPKAKDVFTYQYLEIPLKINWYAINSKFKVFPSIGASANIFLGKKTVTELTFEDGSKTTGTSHGYNKKNIPTADMAILVGLGLSYDVSKNIFIKAEPAYRQFIRPLVDSPISGAFYSFGMNAGVYFRL